MATLFDVSRVTASRAMQELARTGMIVAVRGVGSFVGKSCIRPKSRQQQRPEHPSHSVQTGRVIRLGTETAPPAIASHIGLALGEPVFRLLAVYKDERADLRIEESFVRPDFAPSFCKQDFRILTATDHLQGLIPTAELRLGISAVAPQVWQQDIAALPANQPCIEIQQELRCDEFIIMFGRITTAAWRFATRGKVAPGAK
jgi:GntR family histidine utilization transcriptional repressor